MKQASTGGEAALPANLLAEMPERGARLVALVLFDETCAAADRLRDDRDAEALHDFRVGMRRLRSHLRTYRRYLWGLPAKLRRRVKKLARATNAARDAEVQLAWLAAERDHLPPICVPAYGRLVARLETRRDAGYQTVRAEVRDRFHKLAPTLRDHLGRFRVQVDLLASAPVRTYAEVSAELVVASATEVGDGLRAVHRPAEIERAHDARLSAKRLRYLLEPLRSVLPDAKGIVKELKVLQDLLGELHDRQVLAAEISDATTSLAGLRAADFLQARLAGELFDIDTAFDVVQGLVVIAEHVQRSEREIFDRLSRDWFADRARPFLARIRAFAGTIHARPSTDSAFRSTSAG